MSVEVGEVINSSTIEPMMGSRQRRPVQRRTVQRDALIVGAMTLIVTVLCVRFNASEALFHWSRHIEWLQLDELPVVLLVLTLSLLWFAARRYREGVSLWKQQIITDARLSIALNENRRLAQQYLEALESERKHLARELHDELGQYVNAIKLDAVAIRNAGEVDIRDMTASIERNTDHVYLAVTELIRKLRPVGLDDLGLVAAVDNLLDSWRQRMSMKIELTVEGDFFGLSEASNLTVFRLVQEGMTNVAKHAQASHVVVILRRSAIGDQSVVVSIEDDGVGMNQSQSSMGFGLVGMRERVEMQGGRFDISGAPKRGFKLVAMFPA